MGQKWAAESGASRCGGVRAVVDAIGGGRSSAAIIASGLLAVFASALVTAQGVSPAATQSVAAVVPAAVPANGPDTSALAPSSREWEKILPLAQNFKIDGDAARAAKKPILIFFNLTGCHYCRGALREVIVPMYRSKDWRELVEFRQITVDDGRRIVDFSGKTLESIEFARARRGTFTPTVLLVDGDGAPLGDPIVGVANFDFYGAYVETLLNNGVAELRKR